MTPAWMLQALLAGVLLGAGALAAERVAGWFGLPRRGIWVAAMLGSLLLPALAVLFPGALPRVGLLEALASSPSAEGARVFQELVLLPAMIGERAPPSGGGAAMDGLTIVIGVAWTAASLALLFGLVLTYARLRALRSRCTPLEIDGAPVLVSGHAGPVVLGLMHPVVVVPQWVVDASEDERRMILRHEREHIAASDVWILALGTALVAAFPWHLPLWWQHRRLRLGVETDCDARVLAGGTDRRSYAGALLRTAGGSSFLLSLSPAWGKPAADLEHRIVTMTTRRPTHSGLRCTLLMGLALGLVAMACDVVKPTSAPEPAAPVGQMPSEPLPSVIAGSPGDEEGFAYPVASLDTKPELMNKGEVAGLMQGLYPRDLRGEGIGGTVMMQFVIQADGKVDPASVKVVDSTHEQFGEASVKAVEKFRFRPGRYKGQNVRVLIQMPITWQP
jgi:bla regulator protein BlaR1